MLDLVLTRKAQRFYEQANPDLLKRLNRCFDQLRQNPYQSANIKSLKGELAGCFRYRVSDWRVVYRVEAMKQDEKSEEKLTITVLTIAHRREVYRDS